MPRTDPSSGGDLPVELTNFVGRRDELAEVKRLLGESRLVTLTGVGGAGKTRLALRVATEVGRAFPDGVWFVDLTALRAPELLILNVQDPDVLAYLVMTALGVREQPGAGSPMEQLVRHLAGRRALLVLDNCEHLLPVAAVLVDALLRGCAQLRILATSREPLLIAGEVLFAVPPLPTPGPGAQVGVAAVGRYEAVALFVARARAVMPAFALTEENAGTVGELCRRLDGLPLAIELAAARVRVLTPAQILDRLTERFSLLSRGSRTAPARQQTLRACAEWSFDLCAKPERLLWGRLSVFAGGCELDAIEGICADEKLPAEDLLEVVAGLVDKSILVSEPAGGVARYRMLETLRDYGQDKLRGWAEDDELRRRHRDWYATLARRAEAEMVHRRQPDWLAWATRELPNLRAALEYSLTDAQGAETTLAIAVGLRLFWGVRGLHREGRFWLDRALARPTALTTTRITALYESVILASHQGDLATVTMRARQAHEVAAQLGDAHAHVIAASAAGMAAMVNGDLAEAERCWQDAVDGLARQPADEHLAWRATALLGLGMTRGMLGDVDGATRCHEAIVAICRPRGDAWFSGFSLVTLGLGLWQRGDPTGAAARVSEAVQHLRRINDTLGTSSCLEALAWIACDEGRLERTATLLGAAARLNRAMGTIPAMFPQLVAHHEQYQQRTRAALGEPAYQAAFTRGEQLSLDEAIAYALNQPLPPPATPPSADASTPLTRRERQVAELVAEGLSDRDIAAKLVISRRTAESHVQHILTKLGLGNRAHLAAWVAAQRQAPAPSADLQ